MGEVEQIIKKLADGSDLSNYERTIILKLIQGACGVDDEGRVKLPYPLNLLKDITMDIYDRADEVNGMLDRVELAIKTLDNERLENIIHMRYKDGMTFQEIGDKLGITKIRAQQLTQYALMKLRHHDRVKILFEAKSIEAEIMEAKIKRDKALAQFENELTELEARKAQVEELKKDVQAKESENITSLLITPLEDAGFSNRTYNGLARYGCKNIGDVYKLGYCELSDIQNLGKKSVEEVIAYFSDHGIALKY